MPFAEMDAMELRVECQQRVNEMTMENSMRGWILPFILILLCTWATPVQAWMWEVGDEELAEVTGEGFSSFTLEDDVARAYFNITASTYTEIDSLKMGYYHDGTSYGWDQNWTGVSLGSPTEDLVCKGLYLEAGFSSISDPANRQLDYLKFGTPSMTGPVSANFISFSGQIKDPSGVDIYNGHRLSPGQMTIHTNNSNFEVTLDANAGWQVYWDNATVTTP